MQKSRLISQMFMSSWEIDVDEIKIKKTPSKHKLSRKKTVSLNQVEEIDN